MSECFNLACPYCVDYKCKRTATCDMRLDGEYVKVKHGRWLSVKVMDDEADFGEVDGAECSVCGYTTNSDYWAKTYYKFCPNCGADMRGGENDRIHR